MNMRQAAQGGPGAMQSKVRKIHMIGIGGSGMSGIAEVLLNLGYEVSGSDMAMGAAVKRLGGLGGAEPGELHGDHLGAVATAGRLGVADEADPLAGPGQQLAERQRQRDGAVALAGNGI